MSDSDGYQDDMPDVHDPWDDPTETRPPDDWTDAADHLIAARLASMIDKPDEFVAQAHVEAASRASVAPTQMGRGQRHSSLLARIAVAAVTFVVVSSGAAYAGVLPEEIGTRIGSVIASLGSPSLAAEPVAMPPVSTTVDEPAPVAATSTTVIVPTQTPTTAAAVASSDEIAAIADRAPLPIDPLAAVHEFREAARRWAACVIEGESECGDAPRPTAFGISDEMLDELPDRLAEQVEQLIGPERRRIACAVRGESRPYECIETGPRTDRTQRPDVDQPGRERRQADSGAGGDGVASDGNSRRIEPVGRG